MGRGKHRAGGLPQNVAPEHYVSFALKTDQPLSSQLLQRSQEGSRNIIMVAVRGKAVSHAINLVRTDMGAIVIDGQCGLHYNLNAIRDRERFDKYYGPGKGVVQIYQTGAAPAPDIDDSALREDWAEADTPPDDDKKQTYDAVPQQIIGDYFR